MLPSPSAFTLVAVHISTTHDRIVSELLRPLLPWTTCRIWTAAVADIYISVILSWELQKKKTGIRDSDRMINKLITYVVNRGVLAALVQIALCGTYAASIKRQTLIWIIFSHSGCEGIRELNDGCPERSAVRRQHRRPYGSARPVRSYGQLRKRETRASQ
ncbi:hypothetical protein DAEQUDRAFT_730212 [Daedalea quercina L-15889]|uniref:DUF6534 domain-containing protein n=1 Tax=Daedalea quercina L-15889 TaxID=1314783 RepID=A0A165N4K4_9APHY|nr:hypothetical protein DAEQUDRAFT_730212 [Daedalea quercina L-15889]